nr:omptin family outer membrane protease [Sodalis ligni]
MEMTLANFPGRAHHRLPTEIRHALPRHGRHVSLSKGGIQRVAEIQPWVSAKDNDEHYLRQATFRHKANNSHYYSAAVDAGYYVTPNAKIFVELSFNKYEQKLDILQRQVPVAWKKL